MADNEMEYISAESTFTDEVEFIETDAEEIVNRLIENFEEYTGETLYPGDERRMFLQGFGYVLANAQIHINETGRGNLLRYAIGNQLDALGDLYSNPRLTGNYAVTMIEFTLSKSQTVDVIIPAGTKVTPDGEHFFTTDEAVIFAANTQILTQTVGATAVEVGEEYNDFIIGQINNLVESNEYIQSVKNTVASSGGTDPETDEDYKQRLRLSPFNFSVAGPSESYRSIAMSVSSDIEDVYVYSPSAGVVRIVLLKQDGVIPDESDPIIAQVLAACSDRTVRPLTDNVEVVPATASNITISVEYYVPNGDTSVIAAITEAVEEYKTWQTSKIGRDINPDYLNKLMIEAGAARVVISSPTYTALEKNEIAQVTSCSVAYKGSINM